MKATSSTKITYTIGNNETKTLNLQEYVDLFNLINDAIISPNVPKGKRVTDTLTSGKIHRYFTVDENLPLFTVLMSQYNNTIHLHFFPRFEALYNVVIA